jgi:Cu/Ag efflux pump CusA
MQQRRLVVGFNVRGRDLESVVKDVQKSNSENVVLPDGMRLEGVVNTRGSREHERDF